MKKFKSIRHLIALVVILALMLSTSAVVYASTGSVAITGGTLAVTPADITNFTGVTLDGTDKTSTSASANNSWAAEDPTGTGTGWNLTIISTDFGINEVQQVNIGTSTAGTFTLTYSGETTAAIAFDATALAVETALEALTNITDVTVTGTGTTATPWVVTFVDPGKQNVAQMTSTDTLTGGSSTISTTTQGRTIDISTVADQAFKIQLLDANIAVTTGNTKPTSSVPTLTAIPETGGTALKFLSAAVDTGMGDYTINPNFELAVRSETYAGTYTATFTVAIVSGP